MSCRRPVVTLALVLATFPMAPGAVGAQATLGVQAITATGYGTVIGGDTAQARDEAIIDARLRALEQVSGVHVDSRTIVENEILRDSDVWMKAGGFIKADRVLSEGPTGDGRYRVEIEAWVAPGEVGERLASLASELSIVVLVAETNLGREQEQRRVENELVARLTAGGYRVLDAGQAARLRARDREAALFRGDLEATRRIGLQFLANIVLTGQVATRRGQDNQGIMSAYARATVRAIETETGRVLASLDRDRVIGFALSMEEAGVKALDKAAEPTANELVAALDEHFKRRERRVEIRVRGLRDLAEYQRVKSLLGALRWVQDIREAGFSPVESVLTVQYPEKTVYLAARLGREPGYRLLEFDRFKVVLEARR